MSNLFLRNKITDPQTSLKGEERKKNIKGVFSLNYNLSLQLPSSIIIFDDVWTTGSTIKEAIKVIKRRHKVNVWGLTIARAI